MTKWTNDDDEIFETEDEARDRCYDMITEDDIVEVIKDSYIIGNCSWTLYLLTMFGSIKSCRTKSLIKFGKIAVLPKLKRRMMKMENEIKCPWCGSTNTNLDSVEDSFFESSSCQVIWNAHCNICNRQFFQYDNFILSSSYAEKKED